MITNNFKNMLKLALYCFGAISSTTAHQFPDAAIVGTNGVSNLGWVAGSSSATARDNVKFASAAFLQTYTSSGKYLAVGTGDTPVADSDYTLTDMVLVEVPSTRYALDGNSRPVISAMFSNTGAAPVTYREIGYVARMNISGGAGTSVKATNDYLLARQVLPEPVTLNPGESATLTMTVEW